MLFFRTRQLIWELQHHAGLLTLLDLLQVTMQYHIRVLVPAYKESAELVIRTMSAAHDALLPAGCTRTLYLCDDGKDPQKRKWCQRMGPGVQYVSGALPSDWQWLVVTNTPHHCLLCDSLRVDSIFSSS